MLRALLAAAVLLVGTPAAGAARPVLTAAATPPGGDAVVLNGRVESIVHVSTGAGGNTPVGTWRIYRKVPGWDWVLARFSYGQLVRIYS